MCIDPTFSTSHLLCTESDGLEGGAADSLLLIEAFGGIGGLRKALELIGVLPQGIILIDTDPLCAKLAKRHCAYVMVIDNIKKVTKEMVKQWRVQFARSKRVLLGGVALCQSLLSQQGSVGRGSR